LKLEYLQKFKGFKDKKVRDAVGATLSSKDSKIKDSTDFYTKDPLTKKGEKILAAMKKIYGEEKGEQIFYASKNKGTITGVDKKMKDTSPNAKDVTVGSVITFKIGGGFNQRASVTKVLPEGFMVQAEDGELFVPIRDFQWKDECGGDSSAPQEFNELKAWQNKAMELNYRLENNQQRGLWVAYRGNTEAGTFVPTRGGRLYIDAGAGLQGACGGERKYDGKGPRFGQDKKTKDALSEFDKKQLARGKHLKIILPAGQGEPLYTNSFSAAVEMAKEYGKGTQVVDLTKVSDSKTKDGSLDEIIRKMAREKADVPYNDDGTIRTPQQAQLAYEQWYKIIKSRYKNDSRWAAEYGDSKTKDDYKRIKLADLLKKAKEGYFELQSDPKPRNHVEIKYPDGKKEWVFVEDQEIKIIIGDDPVNPSPAEQKVEGNDVIYKEYTLKQLPETGEFEIYAPGGSIVGHAKALELAKLFVDRIIASKVMYE